MNRRQLIVGRVRPTPADVSCLRTEEEYSSYTPITEPWDRSVGPSTSSSACCTLFRAQKRRIA